MYKKSRYNLFIPFDDEKTIIFNTLSGAIGLFEDNLMERYNSVNLSQEEISILLKKGIIVPNNYNERLKVDEDRRQGIDDKKHIHFEIWTTTNCNANCYYCFEKGINKAIDMERSTADAVISLIQSKITEGSILHLGWFGGEPLLNFEIIDYIIEKIKPVCKYHNCKIVGSLTTNGSLITKEIAKKIKNDWYINTIQITLDGYRNYYEQVKDYYDSAHYNFNSLIESIQIIADEEINLSLRMNYDINNYNSLVELINFLYRRFKLYKNISGYIYPLWSSTDETATDQFISTAIADKKIINLFDLLVSYEMNTPKKVAKLNYKKYQCRPCSKNSLAILPNGDFIKCSDCYKQIIGNVWEGITNKNIFEFWTDCEVDKKCKDCIYLPICQGGCKASNFTRKPQCFAYKPILSDILKWYINYSSIHQKR